MSHYKTHIRAIKYVIDKNIIYTKWNQKKDSMDHGNHVATVPKTK